MRPALLLSAILHIAIVMGCSCTQAPKKLDPENAVSAHDFTALISGCGVNQIGIGYIACRMPEGAATADAFLYIHAPPKLNCEGEACVYYKVFIPREGGRNTLEGSIPKGESFAKIPWSDLTDKPQFDLADRGFYGVSVTVHYEVNGENLKTYSNGYVFMHVTKKGYLSLQESEDNESYVWQWTSPTGQKVKMTTGGRVYVSPLESTQVSWLP